MHTVTCSHAVHTCVIFLSEGIRTFRRTPWYKVTASYGCKEVVIERSAVLLERGENTPFSDECMLELMCCRSKHFCRPQPGSGILCDKNCRISSSSNTPPLLSLDPATELWPLLETGVADLLIFPMIFSVAVIQSGSNLNKTNGSQSNLIGTFSVRISSN